MSQPAADASAPILQVRGLTLRFGGLTAVSDVNLAVQRGEIAAVIGPNGAGKTSLFNAITGIYEPTEGTVEVCGRDVQTQLTTRHKLRFAAAGLFLGLLALLSAQQPGRLVAGDHQSPTCCGLFCGNGPSRCRALFAR
jgi:ABC-type multidrug transport system ATPase subunit